MMHTGLFLWLTISLVQLCRADTNIALGRPAYMENYYDPVTLGADRVTDGCVTALAFAPCYCAVADIYLPDTMWLAIDLEHIYAVDSIVLHTAMDQMDFIDVQIGMSYNDPLVTSPYYGNYDLCSADLIFSAEQRTIYCNGQSGRYVVLDLIYSYDFRFYMCEVEVYGERSIAGGKTVYLSSVDVPGMTDGHHATDECPDLYAATGCNCAMTMMYGETDSWLAVDLGGYYDVTTVKISHSYDSVDFMDLMIGLSNTNPSVTPPVANSNYQTCANMFIMPGERQSVSCGPVTMVLPRYVIVQLIFQVFFQIGICEIEIYGSPLGPPENSPSFFVSTADTAMSGDHVLNTYSNTHKAFCSQYCISTPNCTAFNFLDNGLGQEVGECELVDYRALEDEVELRAGWSYFHWQ